MFPTRPNLRACLALAALLVLGAGAALAPMHEAAAQNVAGQRIAALADGVVRITSTSDGARRTGTGIIVQTTDDAIYIATASHVVEGDKTPRITFRPEPNTEYAGQVLRLEGGDPKGLALLVVRNEVRRLVGRVTVLPLSTSNELSGGDQVTAIGFPQGGGAWAVVPASIASRDGRELVLAGNLGEGNSGGPLLKDGTVVGLVTVMQGQYGRATPAPIVRIAMEGWGVKPGATARRAAQGQGGPVADTEAGKQPDAPSSGTAGKPGSSDSAAGTPGGNGGNGGVGTDPNVRVTGTYAGQLQGMSALGQTYVCGFAAVIVQTGIDVSGQYQNTCGDQGVFAGQVVQGKLAGGTASQVNGGYCTMLIEIGKNGAALAGQYECLNGERGSFNLQRQ